MNDRDFCLVSLGCPKNLVDSELVVGDLAKNAFKLVQEGTTESIVVLNTCAFIKSAVEETEGVIADLILRKDREEIKYIVVMGCFPSRYKKGILANKFPRVDLWIPIKDKKTLAKEIEHLFDNSNIKDRSQSKSDLYVSLTPSYYSYIKISEGCSNFCSYCTIPKIRGAYKSRSIEDIGSEIEEKVSNGLKEAILVAEDTTLWGVDFYGKPSLNKLLEELARIKGLEWIRIMYAYPSRIDEKLIEIISQSKNICNYLDIPLQHVSSDILQGMNRTYTKKDLDKLFELIKVAIPDIALRTSLILGFPGEKNSDFLELLSFFMKNYFEHLGCFLYSDEKGTASFNLANKVKATTGEMRIDKLMKQQFELVTINNQRMIGKTFKVIYEGDAVARSFREAPEIDSCIYLSNVENLIRGQFYQAEITGIQGYDLVGSPI
jgi:ribosomal protein S12 methylthiotransferase